MRKYFSTVFVFLVIILATAAFNIDRVYAEPPCYGGTLCDGTSLSSTPAGTTVCGTNHTPYTCTYMPEYDASSWVQGSGTCYTASCPAPVNGDCNNAHYACLSGVPTDPFDGGSYWGWRCAGANGGTSASCTEIKPVCGSSHYNCSSGVPTNSVDNGSYWGWNCTSSGAAVGCSETKIIPTCSSTHYNCSAGVQAGSTTETSSAWYWTCSGGSAGTSDVSCSETKPVIPVDGTCAGTHYNCTSGTSGNNLSLSNEWRWACYGSNGGTSDTGCAQEKPGNGACSYPASHYLCDNGTSANNASGSSSWTWDCQGWAGGTAASCSEAKPVAVNGSCSSVHYGCVSGSSGGGSDNPTNWTWSCAGSNGGSTAFCSENKPASGASGSLSASGCSIASGSSTCSAHVTWSTSNLPSGSSTALTRNNPDGTTVSTATSGSNVSNTVNYGQSSYFLYNNGTALASASINIDCALGSAWNGSTCVAVNHTVTGTAGSGGTISPSSRTVSSGSTTTFTVTPSSGYTASASGCGGSLSGTTYTTAAITADCTVTASFTNTPQPNLTAYSATPFTASPNVAQTYSATIQNIGSASTSSSFNNFWQKATAGQGGGTVTDLSSSNMSALAASASATSTSPSITFTSSGTYSVRVCADKSSSGSGGSITESNENDNCGPWIDVVVGIAGNGSMSGSLTPSAASCAIASGASSCSINLSWTVNNPVVAGGTAVTSDTNNAGASSPNFSIAPPVSSGNADNGTKTGVTIPYNSRTFFLYNNGAMLASSNIFSSCVSGTGWNGSICTPSGGGGNLNCGNGNIDSGEECDDGALNGNYCPATCNTSCQIVSPCKKRPIFLEE